MDIRRAMRGEIEAVNALLEAAGLVPLHSGIPASSVFVAVEENRLIAVTALEVTARVGLSSWLAVVEDYRSRGIGTAMLRTLLTRAQELGLRQLFMTVPRSSALFERAGFRPVDASEVSRQVRSLRGYPEPDAGEFSVIRAQFETPV